MNLKINHRAHIGAVIERPQAIMLSLENFQVEPGIGVVLYLTPDLARKLAVQINASLALLDGPGEPVAARPGAARPRQRPIFIRRPSAIL